MPSIPRDWFNIPDEAVAVGGLPAAQTIEALRNNIIAAMQGASGAPFLHLSAFERLEPGTQARILNNSGFQIGFYQGGTVRISGRHRGVNGISGIAVGRTRADVTVTLVEWSYGFSNFQNRSIDVSVLPGDLLTVGVGGSGEVLDLGLFTNGQDLIPAPGSFGVVRNNRALS